MMVINRTLFIQLKHTSTHETDAGQYKFVRLLSTAQNIENTVSELKETDSSRQEKKIQCTLSDWVPDKPIIVETDASDYPLGAILSIQTDSREIHPGAFHSRIFSAPELNYDTHDKELLAIFDAFRVWRHFLELIRKM